jgi:hypothetical protein
MIDRTEACFDLKPKRLAADTAYGAWSRISACERFAPHCPVIGRILSRLVAPAQGR